MQNLSRPSDLNAAVEGQRREGRRGFDDSPGPMGLMFPGHPPGSPFPYPLSPALTGALPGLMSPGIRDDSRLPMLPPTSKFSSSNFIVEMNCYSILIICHLINRDHIIKHTAQKYPLFTYESISQLALV